MKDLITKGKSVHQEVQEILPWFVNGSLADKERIKVMTHLTECADCRGERDQLQGLREQIAQESEPAGDYRPAFGKLMARIDAAENDKDSRADLTTKTAPRPQWLAYAVAAAVLLGVYMIIALPSSEVAAPSANDGLHTLNIPAPSRQGKVERLALTFEQPIKAQTLRAAFIETGSYIVSGPDTDGKYVVDIIVPDAVSRDEFIRSIQDIDGVKYAAYQP